MEKLTIGDIRGMIYAQIERARAALDKYADKDLAAAKTKAALADSAADTAGDACDVARETVTELEAKRSAIEAALSGLKVVISSSDQELAAKAIADAADTQAKLSAISVELAAARGTLEALAEKEQVAVSALQDADENLSDFARGRSAAVGALEAARKLLGPCNVPAAGLVTKLGLDALSGKKVLTPLGIAGNGGDAYACKAELGGRVAKLATDDLVFTVAQTGEHTELTGWYPGVRF